MYKDEELVPAVIKTLDYRGDHSADIDMPIIFKANSTLQEVLDEAMSEGGSCHGTGQLVFLLPRKKDE